MKFLQAVSITAALVVSGYVNAAPITQLNITGGSFSLNGGVKEAFYMGDFANMTVGGFDGSVPTSVDFSPTSIAYFTGFSSNNTVAVYTSAADGVNSGFAEPTGDITAGVATLELDSWTIWENGGVYNQGSTSTKGAAETCVTTNTFVTRCSTPVVVDSYNAATGAFSASWDSVFVGGVFNGVLGGWNIEGVMSTGSSAVPVPAAVWLFGSGLIGLVSFSRRKKA